MTDPFDAIFGEDPPVTVRHAFVEQLRARLQAEIDDTPPGPGSETVNYGSLFYFTIPAADLDRSGRFYSELFDWELHRGDHGYHVANVYPPMGLGSSDATECQVWFEVDDIEAAVAKVRELGGQAEDPVYYDSGSSSACVDPQGVHFHLQVPVEAYRQPARRSTEAGELFYWALPAPEAARSKEFYRDLFGWDFGTPGNQGGMHIENRLPDGGLGGGRQGTHPQLFFRVHDLDRAVAKVRELGGTAEPAGEGPEGRHAMCSDDQGIAFGLSEPADGA